MGIYIQHDVFFFFNRPLNDSSILNVGPYPRDDVGFYPGRRKEKKTSWRCRSLTNLFTYYSVPSTPLSTNTAFDLYSRIISIIIFSHLPRYSPLLFHECLFFFWLISVVPTEMNIFFFSDGRGGVACNLPSTPPVHLICRSQFND